MLAHRLAAYVAHTVDVEAMLDSISEQQLRYWQAFDLLEPLGPETLYTVLSRVGTVAGAAWGHPVAPEEFVPRWQPPGGDDDDDIDEDRLAAEYELEAGRQIELIRGLVSRHNAVTG